jgi:hypothetical protein
MLPSLILIILICIVGAILGLLIAVGCCKAALLARQGKAGADLVETARCNLREIHSAEELVSKKRKQKARMLRLQRAQSEQNLYNQTAPGLPQQRPSQVSVAVQVNPGDTLVSNSWEESDLAEISIHTGGAAHYTVHFY